MKELTNQIKKEIVLKMDYRLFDEIVNKFYNKNNYDIVAYEELNNYSSKEYNIKKKKLSPYDEKNLQNFIDTDYQWVTQILFQDLCNKGILEEGKYIIDVSW